MLSFLFQLDDVNKITRLIDNKIKIEVKDNISTFCGLFLRIFKMKGI